MVAEIVSVPSRDPRFDVVYKVLNRPTSPPGPTKVENKIACPSAVFPEIFSAPVVDAIENEAKPSPCGMVASPINGDPTGSDRAKVW